MSEVVLYDKEDGESIDVDISDEYKAMLDSLKDKEGDMQSEYILSRVIEQLMHSEIQQMARTSQLHPAYATLILQLQETGEIDIQSVVENAIHQVVQNNKGE